MMLTEAQSKLDQTMMQMLTFVIGGQLSIEDARAEAVAERDRQTDEKSKHICQNLIDVLDRQVTGEGVGA